MAGHSKFKNIMHRKGRADAQRSKLFSKLSRDITVAAKSGLPDPAANPRLRLAVNNAKAESLPKDVIQRAINKAAGGDVDTMEEVRYEGRGPGGVGIIVEALTDNRNRAASNIGTAFKKNGGALGDDYPYILEGIGGSLLYVIDQYGDEGSLYDAWDEIEGWEEAERKNSVGLEVLDHLTHNVRRGQMRTWSGFYGSVFNFEEQKYFDIKGKATGLFSQAMIAPDRAIRIPLNESQDENSQIEEFIRRYNGEGIQHIALTTENIFETVEAMRERGVDFQDTIETYFELIDKRLPGHGEDVERMRKNRILIDGSDEEGLLLQIFTQDAFGPIFFEIIQRKGNEGFGNGNFQALFDSIELDQIRRGVIKVDA